MSGGMQQGKTRHVVTLVMGSHLWDRGAPLNGEVRSQAKIGEAMCVLPTADEWMAFESR